MCISCLSARLRSRYYAVLRSCMPFSSAIWLASRDEVLGLGFLEKAIGVVEQVWGVDVGFLIFVGHHAVGLRRLSNLQPSTFRHQTSDNSRQISVVIHLHIIYIIMWRSHHPINAFAIKQVSIKPQIDSGDWCFVEPPKAYTWDPESTKFFSDLGLEVYTKDSYYTSIHYIVKPNNSHSIVCCEIQVRTLFEEIWGEIDHAIFSW